MILILQRIEDVLTGSVGSLVEELLCVEDALGVLELVSIGFNHMVTQTSVLESFEVFGSKTLIRQSLDAFEKSKA